VIPTGVPPPPEPTRLERLACIAGIDADELREWLRDELAERWADEDEAFHRELWAAGFGEAVAEPQHAAVSKTVSKDERRSLGIRPADPGSTEAWRKTEKVSLLLERRHLLFGHRRGKYRRKRPRPSKIAQPRATATAVSVRRPH
jgi:hypothetical protein